MSHRRQHARDQLTLVLFAFASLLSAPTPVLASRTKAIREAVEYATRKFSKEAAQEGVETMTSKLTNLATKHGDDAITAFRKVGPQSLRLIEEAGTKGHEAIRLMVRMGDDAVWVVSQPRRLAIFVRFGDDAAEALIKHKGIADELVEELGAPAVKALNSVGGQNARRLAMMKESGELAKINRSDAVLETIGRYGDKAADFVWRNKGALMTATALTAFLNDPRPFIDGAKELVVGTVENPLVEAARHTNWTLLGGIALVVFAVIVVAFAWRRGRRGLRRRDPLDDLTTQRAPAKTASTSCTLGWDSQE